MNDASLTIGKVARQAGVNIETLRYYERRGLLVPDDHRESGYRLYTPEAVNRIRFIKSAQQLGFTLNEIVALLRLRVSHKASCRTVKRKAEEKLQNIRNKIAGLKALERVLKDLIRRCRTGATTEACPIMKSLDLSGKNAVYHGGQK
jgi:MerR family mercuric resistance operon transcriptional regulator/MerR family gold-responsive transcriptional activator of gol and ges genes